MLQGWPKTTKQNKTKQKFKKKKKEKREVAAVDRKNNILNFQDIYQVHIWFFSKFPLQRNSVLVKFYL